MEQIAEEYGTPLYVYDGNKILDQVERLKSAFPGMPLKLKYATKALTNPAILKLLYKAGIGADCVSINEIKLAMKAGFEPAKIMFTPNCVDFDEIRQAVKLGVQINIDNLPFLEKMGEEYGDSVPVCIRINPHIQAGGNTKIQTGHVGSKFGISYLQFDSAVEITGRYNMNINGIHIHTGSDILDVDVFLKGAEVVFSAARKFKDLQFLDFGSGFKVAYKQDDVVTDIEELGSKMSAAFQRFCDEYGRQLEMWFEPGKFLVSESGYFLTKVNLVKESPACTFLGVNSGLNHLIRPMMYDAYHEIVNISNPEGKKKVYTVVGYICETDTFGTDRRMSETHEGDILAFKNAGAYGFMMSSNFNSREKPAEVLILDGKSQLIRRRETFDDLLHTVVEAEV